MKPVMVTRRDATQSTLNRYKGKVFSWEKGITCIHLFRFHMRNMGHKIKKVPRFRSEFGAKKALLQEGVTSVSGLLDKFLERIAPAQMLLGDIAVLPSEDGLEAVFICAGPRRFFGWREDHAETVMLEIDLNEISGSWRA
jgi:hypothetical protein